MSSFIDVIWDNWY